MKSKNSILNILDMYITLIAFICLMINLMTIDSEYITGMIMGIDLAIIIRDSVSMLYDFVDTQKTNKEIKRLDKEIASNMEKIKNKKLGR